MGQPAYRVEQMGSNSKLLHFLLQYLLLGSSSVKNLGKDTLSNQEPTDKHDNTRPVHARLYPDTSKGHQNNEHLANREHDLVQTGFECNTRDFPVIVVRSLNAMKGSWKGFREEKRMITQTLPKVSSLSDRKMKCGVFDSCASMINLVISGQDKLMFEIEEHIKSLELNEQLAVDEQADSSVVSENVTNLEIVVCFANETYFVIINNIRALLEILLSISVKSFLMGSRFLDSLEEGATSLVRSLTLDASASIPFIIRNPSFRGSFALDSKGGIPKNRKIVINVNIDKYSIQFESEPVQVIFTFPCIT